MMLVSELASRSALPLCVDLDGTLVRTNTLLESVLAAIVADWRVPFSLPGWLLAGKARLKEELARRWSFDPASLPYNEDVLAMLRAEREAGRTIVLCTAADRRVAQTIADHLGLFDEVIASDGVRNLRGEAKASALVARYGEGGFTYAGNDWTDVPIWEQAGRAIVVAAPRKLERSAPERFTVEAIFSRQSSHAAALLRALRPHQWSKNALCLVVPLAAGTLVLQEWLMTFAAMLAFCATASAIYVMNDMSDLAADRVHPRKSKRPFASGALPLSWGIALSAFLLTLGLSLALASGVELMLLTYAVLSLAYSLKLKELPLVDVFLLAALYTLRLLTGGVASGHAVSLWLLGFSGFLFLGLALIKRVSEMQRIRSSEWKWAHRRGYTVQDLDLLQQMGCASSFASVIVLALYVQSDVASRTYALPEALWAAVPLMLFWQCRLWLATARGYMHDDPIVYAARDLTSWITFASLGAIAVLARWAWVP